MTGLSLAIILTLAPPVDIYDTSDITFDVPYYNNAPVFNMNTGITGQPRHVVRSNRKQHEEKLDKILKEIADPKDEYKFIRFRGHLIVIKR